MTKTTNYQLNQWDPTDRVLRTDFNSDNQKIDAAIAEKIGIVFGSYTGNNNDNRTITLSFTPKAVYLCNELGQTYNNAHHYGGLALEGKPARGSSSVTGAVDLITIVDHGFAVRNGNVQSGSGTYLSANLSGTTYHYLALG